MSALSTLGEVDLRLLNLKVTLLQMAEQGLPEGARSLASEIAAQTILARADLGAIRMALRSPLLEAAARHHEVMAVRLGEAARLARMVPGCPLHAQTVQHEAHARALRVLIGGPEGRER
ncbi:MAG: hypothetical protein HZC55_04225 [Verrucomicrobia bacterium]|nr:hypothetical protein [Verrucomicrobiota bacterium]